MISREIDGGVIPPSGDDCVDGTEGLIIWPLCFGRSAIGDELNACLECSWPML